MKIRTQAFFAFWAAVHPENYQRQHTASGENRDLPPVLAHKKQRQHQQPRRKERAADNFFAPVEIRLILVDEKAPSLRKPRQILMECRIRDRDTLLLADPTVMSARKQRQSQHHRHAVITI